MWSRPSKSTNQGRRAFRPMVTERLETRELMSASPATTRFLRRQLVMAEVLGVGDRGVVRGFTTAGGTAVTVMDTDGERYRISVLNGGRVNAQPLPGGRVGLIISGTGPTSEVDITPVGFAPQGSGHTFGRLGPFQDRRLDVGLIDVVSGQINGIFGFGTAALSGPLIVRGSDTVERIALAELKPGASLIVGGTLNQLEILNEATLSGPGTGIFVGRDLNVLNVGVGLGLFDGAATVIGRDLGLIPQQALGTGVGGQGAFIGGDLAIGPGSAFVIQRNLSGPVQVLGTFAGRDNFTFNGTFGNGSINVVGPIIP